MKKKILKKTLKEPGMQCTHEIPGQNDDNDLPEGWKSVKIGDVVLRCQPGFASGNKDAVDGLAQLRMNNIGLEGELNYDLVRTVPKSLARPQHFLQFGDVLVCTTNSGKLVGKCALFDQHDTPYAFSNHLTCLRPDPNVIESSYLRWALWLSWRNGEHEDKCKHWVNQSTLPKDALLSTEFPLPPLSEQRRIVSKLDELLGKVTSARQRLEKLPTLLKRFRQSVLAAACSGKLTEDWREENDPGNWTVKRADEVCVAVQSGTTPKAHLFTQDGVPFLKVYNIVDQRIAFDYRPQFVSIETCKNSLKRAHVLPGDVLMNIVGPPLGKVAVVPDDYPEWCINQAIVSFRPGKHLDRFFLYYLLCSGVPYADILAETRGSAGQSNISLSQCREMEIPLPPLAEQREIVKRVEQLFSFADRIESRLSVAQASVEKLTQSILAKAFRGQLVATDAELGRQKRKQFIESRDATLDEATAKRLADRPKNRKTLKKMSVSDKAACALFLDLVSRNPGISMLAHQQMWVCGILAQKYRDTLEKDRLSHFAPVLKRSLYEEPPGIWPTLRTLLEDEYISIDRDDNSQKMNVGPRFKSFTTDLEMKSDPLRAEFAEEVTKTASEQDLSVPQKKKSRNAFQLIKSDVEREKMSSSL